MSFEYRHEPSVPRVSARPSLAWANLLRRKSRCADERKRAHVPATPRDEEAAPGRPDAPGARRSLPAARARHAPQPRRDQPGLARRLFRADDLAEARIVPDRVEILVVAGQLCEGRTQRDALAEVPDRRLGLAQPRLGAGDVVEQPLAILVPVERLGQRSLGAVVVALAEEREDGRVLFPRARPVDRVGLGADREDRRPGLVGDRRALRRRVGDEDDRAGRSRRSPRRRP